VQDLVPDRGIESAEDAISKQLLKQDLAAVLHTLNPRERDVLRLRYGLDDGRTKTLEEIGHIFRVTRERIRQIEAKAMRKLRQPSRNNALREYLEIC
jgi:RNA polymerase primary sigma factor